MSLHLHPLQQTEFSLDPVYLVIQRSNGHWSPAAKVLHVLSVEIAAEDMAAKLKREHPQQTFGVFKLRSEARTVAQPVQIVRMEHD